MGVYLSIGQKQQAPNEDHEVEPYFTAGDFTIGNDINRRYWSATEWGRFNKVVKLEPFIPQNTIFSGRGVIAINKSLLYYLEDILQADKESPTLGEWRASVVWFARWVRWAVNNCTEPVLAHV